MGQEGVLAVLTSAWDRLHVELLEEDAEMALETRQNVRGHVGHVGYVGSVMHVAVRGARREK